jgi:hypothetical protein
MIGLRALWQLYVGQRPRLRIVRSQRRAAPEAYSDDRIARLEPDENVVLPYDFR